ncbi:hypothetical protein ABE525_13350 [Pseudomonas wadenswilerensis]|uniref:hypothetical protein n=1 Tax=Pseudomonas wadenswilerensis TaxID=1785161 RepID=UPI00320A8C6F
MTTHRQRSFIATLSTPLGSFGFLDQLHSVFYADPQDTFTWTSINIPSAGHMLGHVNEKLTSEPLKLYVRFTEGGYILYVRSKAHFGKCIGYKNGYFGAFDPKEQSPAKFGLEAVGVADGTSGQEIQLGGGAILSRLISLDTGKPLALREQTLSYYSNKVWRRRPVTCIAAHGAQAMDFHVNVLETNSAYLSHPDEI